MTDLADGTAEEAGFRPEQLELIRERANSWVEAGRTPSLVVLAARRGIVALHEAFGRQTPESQDKDLATDAVFHLPVFQGRP